ncbi:PREDICTED: uncharacterized protein LOC106748777 [Dinoponera quadriceps]|uniref:Uncharacterized protein LOC106748777 n=1 Tax=Dinoponera quadriceps TaxID=609295 RepID=A0A6P3XYH2_DINQU|nr:PREDICTED: uncharacterized protein LOC106748777 [Dinoponera quadriceps]
MKFALALLALVATASAKIEIPNFGRGQLYKDIQEFLDLMPTDEMFAIAVKYVTEDAEFQRLFTFLQSPEFKSLTADVEALKEIRTLMDYIHHAGIDIYKIVNGLNDLLGLAHLTPPDDGAAYKNYKTNGIRGFLDEIEAILPIKELQALYDKKLKESKAFADFINQLKSPNFQEIVNKVYAHPTVQKLLDEARKAGVDLKAVREALETILGIKIPGLFTYTDMHIMKFSLALFAILAVIGFGQAHNLPDFGKGPLHEDIQNFLDLIPMEDIAGIFLDYMENDAEFKQFADFVKASNGQVLRDLMIDVEAVPEVINLLNFLQKEGVDIYTIVNVINQILGIKELTPPTYFATTMKRTGGLAGFFKDVKVLIDYNKFIHYYVERMENSPAFVRFVQQLKSNNFQQVVNKVYVSKSFQTILTYLKDRGVNTRIVAEIMYIVLGITVPKHTLMPVAFERSLFEELQDFVRLLPLEKFFEITTEYALNDEKVQKAVAFILTPEFHDLLRDVEALKEHQNLIVFLEKAGIPAIEMIKVFHQAIGMGDYVPPKIDDMFKSQFEVQKVGEGLKAMLNDLEAIIPKEKLQELYNEKMKTTNVFSDFVKKVTSPDMKKIIFNLYGHPTYIKLVTKCMDQGLDLKALSDFYKKIVPIPIPTPVF